LRIPFHFHLPAGSEVNVRPEAAARPEQAAAARPGAQPGGPRAAEPPQAPAQAAQAPRPAPPPAPPARGGAAFEASVTASRLPPSRGAADYHVEVGALALVPRQEAGELLKLAPGVLLTNEGSEAHADQVFLRGFDAREGQDIEFTAGGVPINEGGNPHGNGYADTHFIIPELVQNLRVIEGPFDPRQGNYAVAGSADYQLGLEKRGLTAKYTGGSFNTQRMLVMWGPQG